MAMARCFSFRWLVLKEIISRLRTCTFFLLGFQNLAADFVKTLKRGRTAFFIKCFNVTFKASTQAATVSRRLQFKVENIYLIEKNMENYFKTGFTQISLALAAQNLMET